MTAALLACDWGTTNLRAWALGEDGRVLARRDFPFGVSRIARGEAPARFAEAQVALDAVGAPAILCGMVGSTLGYRPDSTGFFLTPADQDGNNLRVFVLPGAIRHIRYL